MNLGDFSLDKVWAIKALENFPKEDEARKILENVANQIEPIMIRRKWRVKLLSEFCPTNPRVLGVNVNRGEQVNLRLRRVNQNGVFLPYHEILDTMLHELCHNTHGPHNASFYKLWDELRKEYEDLMSTGITGTGELLGGFPHYKPPLSSLRATAATAGPHRLGGDINIMTDLSPVQAAAMAAERRLLDDIWCQSQSTEALEGQASPLSSIPNPNIIDLTKEVFEDQASPSIPVFIDLTKEGFETISTKRGFSLSDQGSCSKEEPQSGFMKPSVPSTSHNPNQSREETDMWECVVCTFLNLAWAPICEICSAAKPKEKMMKHKVWSCKFCTLENEVRFEKCKACDQWRYL